MVRRVWRSENLQGYEAGEIGEINSSFVRTERRSIKTEAAFKSYAIRARSLWICRSDMETDTKNDRVSCPECGYSGKEKREQNNEEDTTLQTMMLVTGGLAAVFFLCVFRTGRNRKRGGSDGRGTRARARDDNQAACGIEGPFTEG